MRSDGLDLLENRTKQLTIAVIKLCVTLETSAGLRQLSWQLTDSAGSVGANHRAMRRSRSTREFASKLQIVNEEIDETVFWLEVARAVRGNQPDDPLNDVLREAIELRSIFARARSTLRQASS